MGSGLVAQIVVLRPYLDLTDRGTLVLIRMAWSALDRDLKQQPARLYFGGWAPLAAILGFELPDDAPRNPAAHKAVQRAIAELIEKGLIKHANDSQQKGHQTRVYVIAFDL